MFQTTTTGMRPAYRWLAMVLAALALVSAIAMPSPAAAAGSAVSGCFVYTTGYGAGGAPVSLLRWNGSKWVSVASGRLNAGGCGTFNGKWTTPGQYYALQSYQVIGKECVIAGMTAFLGSTGYGLARASGTLNVGTGVISAYRLC